jgi:8-oxo-dGTP pyrophosphatase MutT (NUDIX family)
VSSGEIRQLASREIYRNAWLRLREDDVEFPSGVRGKYSVIDKQDFVVVLPFENDGFWLVEQYRYPVRRREWEFPQGGWSHGKTGTAEELAAIELREETGCTAGSLVHLGRLHAAYGFSSQGYDVFLASDLVAGEPAREITEADMISEWRSVTDVRDMIRRGDFSDAHSVAALALYDLAH